MEEELKYDKYEETSKRDMKSGRGVRLRSGKMKRRKGMKEEEM